MVAALTSVATVTLHSVTARPVLSGFPVLWCQIPNHLCFSPVTTQRTAAVTHLPMLSRMQGPSNTLLKANTEDSLWTPEQPAPTASANLKVCFFCFVSEISSGCFQNPALLVFGWAVFHFLWVRLNKDVFPCTQIDRRRLFHGLYFSFTGRIFRSHLTNLHTKSTSSASSFLLGFRIVFLSRSSLLRFHRWRAGD